MLSLIARLQSARAAVLHGERCEVRIRDEVPERLSLFEKCLQHRPVALGGMDQPDARLIEPARTRLMA